MTGGSSSGSLHPQDRRTGNSSLGSADQACKECRRRKAKCDRGIPTCSLCVKYRRHCLYEKHSRTPLTRRHLTEVEERLERAEALVVQLKSLVPPQHLRQSRVAAPPVIDGPRAVQDFNSGGAPEPRNEAPDEDLASDVDPNTGWPNLVPSPRSGTDPAPQSTQMRSNVVRRRNETARHSARERQNEPPDQPRERDLLEASPAEDDFEWDEQDTLTNYSASPEAGRDNPNAEDGGNSAVDGMATLTVSERESGYLGVASGAALLRILEPTPRPRTNSPTTFQQQQQQQHRQRQNDPLQDPLAPNLTSQPDTEQLIADFMIDAYFSLYHMSYPLVHEATFRAQYSGVIQRPGGACWTVLAYTMAAIGVFTTTTPANTSGGEELDASLFSHARAILSFNFLEVGNVTLVQALTLMANYLQKRNKPNSAYNYLGLAVRMAMGLGLHKEFQGWSISPLKMEIRRRVWWVLCVIDVGATVTFSRPSVFPFEGIEVSLPMNVDDRALTAMSKSYPIESEGLTPYTAVRTQASFHVATDRIYTRVISKPLPTAGEMLQLDEELLQPWLRSVPACFADDFQVPLKYKFAQSVKKWRYLNMRIIMYRPFVIRQALNVRDRRSDDSPDDMKAYERCLGDAKETIDSINDYWAKNEHNRIAAWYALYFLFQAALIPCICIRNNPASLQAPDWKAQILTTTRTITSLALDNSSSARCYQVIMDLCGDFIGDSPPKGHEYPAREVSTLQDGAVADLSEATTTTMLPEPTDTSPQTQINSVLSMMWPNVQPLEAADVVMGDDAWMDFLKRGTIEEGDDSWFDGP